MSSEVLESLQLIHSRLSRLEETRKGGDNRVEALGEVPRWLRNHYEWTMMQAHMDTHVRFLGRDTTPSKQTLKEMNRKYNQYWEEFTGRNPGFYFGLEQYKYITIAEDALKRDQKIMDWLMIENPCIVEPYAGYGADTVAMAFNMNPRFLFCNDRAGAPENGKFVYVRDAIEESKGRQGQRGLRHTQVSPFDYELKNLMRFQETFPETLKSQVVLFNMEARQFFEEATEFRDTAGNIMPFHCDVLYLDPNWTLPGATREATADELVDSMQAEVFEPMFRRGMRPKMIVIKTRFKWEEMRRVMDKIEGYLHMQTILFTPFTREVAFHLLITTEYDVLRIKDSDLKKFVYNKGKEPKGAKGSAERAGGFGEIEFVTRGKQ